MAAEPLAAPSEGASRRPPDQAPPDAGTRRPPAHWASGDDDLDGRAHYRLLGVDVGADQQEIRWGGSAEAWGRGGDGGGEMGIVVWGRQGKWGRTLLVRSPWA